MVMALAGLAVAVLSTLLLAVRLLGEEALVATFLRLPLSALVAAVAGYLLPKGFWLWGIATVSLDPLLFATIPHGSGERLLKAWSLSELILVSAAILVGLVTIHTIAAALGAGSRLLWWRLRGESVRDRLGISSEGEASAR